MTQENIEKANNNFAYKMADILFKEKENIFFSPYSIFSAFSQVYIGARGDTEEQFQEILNYGPQDSFHNLMRESVKRFDELKENIFKVANSLWTESKEEFYVEFLKVLKEQYESVINEVSYSEIVSKVNKWVAEKTEGKITEIIKEDDISKDLLFVLVNAVYFKGKWEEEFEKKNTKERFFYIGDEKKEVDTMFIKENFHYFENEKYQFLSIPYKNREFYMDILLPQKGYSLSDMNINELKDIDDKCRGEDVKVYLPKFKMEYGFTLNSFLKNIGLRKPFIPEEADFSGIADTSQKPIFISSAVHKAFVEVDEEGTEAAAATAVMAFRCCSLDMPKKQIVFRADHPFYFQIKSNFNEVLFLGKVEDPSC